MNNRYTYIVLPKYSASIDLCQMPVIPRGTSKYTMANLLFPSPILPN